MQRAVSSHCVSFAEMVFKVLLALCGVLALSNALPWAYGKARHSESAARIATPEIQSSTCVTVRDASLSDTILEGQGATVVRVCDFGKHTDISNVHPCCSVHN